MKKIIALAAALLASSAYALVENTPHDLSTGSIGVCQYCHMPHNALATAGVPLWAKNLPAVGVGGIEAYTSTRINNGGTTPTIDLTATNYSLLCMSCHDGSATLGTLHNGTVLPTKGGYTAVRPVKSLGLALTNDHPVGLAYPTDGTLPTESGLVSLAAAKTAGYAFFGTGINYIECGTCHDPHTWSADPADLTYRFKRAVTGDFCAGCHGAK